MLVNFGHITIFNAIRGPYTSGIFFIKKRLIALNDCRRIQTQFVINKIKIYPLQRALRTFKGSEEGRRCGKANVCDEVAIIPVNDDSL